MPLAYLFRESPTEPEEGEVNRAVVDADRPGLTWMTAALVGLPFSYCPTPRVPLSSEERGAITPVAQGRIGLTAVGAGPSWALFGQDTDLQLAADYWSLRALGARPSWHPQDALELEHSPRQPPPAVLHGPITSAPAMENTAKRWASGGAPLAVSSKSPPGPLPRGRAHFSSLLQAVPEDGSRFLFSTPPPPAMDGRLHGQLRGVAEFEILSSDPVDPDGITLTRNETSRRLISPNPDQSGVVRVTRGGIAGIRRIASTGLAAVPRISYRSAVAAPFQEAGYEITASDKGRYQQRSLRLARGLRFLSLCFRRQESSRLLDLFFESHLPTPTNASYRRAVTYEDLRHRLHDTLRQRRKRLRRSLIDQADAWLDDWTDELLDRGLLIAGYVLTCPECAHRSWYRLDEIAQHYDCERCAARTHVPASAIRSFRLNEAFYQLRLNNGEVVTLALAALRRQARQSLLYLPEVYLKHDSAKDGEADIAALIDGDLVIAEAKSNNTIEKKEIAWYLHVAQVTKARRLIFASTSRSQPLCSQLKCEACRKEHGPFHRDRAWTDATRERVEQAREAGEDAGVLVETLCYDSLISRHASANDELVSSSSNG